MGDLVVGGLSVVLAYRFGRTTRDIPLAIFFSTIFAATLRPRHRSDPADRGSAPGEELDGRIPVLIQPWFPLRGDAVALLLLCRFSLGYSQTTGPDAPGIGSLAPYTAFAEVSGGSPSRASQGPESP